MTQRGAFAPPSAKIDSICSWLNIQTHDGKKDTHKGIKLFPNNQKRNLIFRILHDF